jgi:tRNA A37 threonylcarbamoyltransferase TsaD
MGEDYDAKDYQIEIQDSLGTQLMRITHLAGHAYCLILNRTSKISRLLLSVSG